MENLSVDQMLIVATLIGGLLGAILWKWTRNIWYSVLVSFATIAIGIFVAWPRPQAQQPDSGGGGVSPPQPVPMKLVDFEPYRPLELGEHGYVSSQTCSECHRDQFHSWHASYHRSMTQVATPEAVLGNFDGVEVNARGRRYLLDREGEVCWVKMHDPDFPPSPQTMVEVPIVMTTGSHHMQVYWYATGSGRTLGQLPIVFLNETQQWIPRRAAFLSPSDLPISAEKGRWNHTCSGCHSTHRRVRRRPFGVFDTRVTELGIACEACHGPAEEHVALHRKFPAGVENDPIVNPRGLTHVASSQICGQCHSVHSSLERTDVVGEQGHGFRPGDDLEATHRIWQRDSEVVRKIVGNEQELRSLFWEDGTMRVAGTEFNGLTKTACYTRGEMSCLSCHSMHHDATDPRSLKEWANDQLTTEALGDAACIQCHVADDYGTDHTHHPEGSSGDRCYNCHMPHTTYALLKAIRTHTVSSPDIAADLKARRPNACNLCHLDKTLQWSATAMQQWYGSQPPTDLSEEQKSVAASVLWLLKGEAGLRALAAWSMGWADAQATSGTDWIPPLVARTMNDPYDAVRFIARRSMRSLPGFEELEIDTNGEEAERKRIIEAALKRWVELRKGADRAVDPAVLLDESGSQIDRIEELMRNRDNSRVRLRE